MRIAQIDVFQVDLPYAGGVYTLSGGRSVASFDATIVRVTTECGIAGWGESTPFGATYVAAHALGVRAGIRELAPAMLGRDPRAVDRNYDLMDQTLLGHPHCKTPIDVACWDIFGQSVGMPVCELLGGSTNTRMPLISSIHAGTPQDMRARVAEHRRRGYVGHSIKVGASEAEGGLALDAARVAESLADRQPGEFFIVDANGGFSVEHALRFLQLASPNLDYVLEAPCATLEETKALRGLSQVPIFIDELADSESAILEIARHNIGEGVGIKISKNGGLTACRRQRDICQAAGLVMSVQDTVGSEIAFAALVHMAQSISPRLLRCVLDVRDMVSVSIADFECDLNEQGVLAPSRPGLGLSPKLDVLGDPLLNVA